MSFVKIGEVSASGAHGSLTITNIPTSYNHLEIYVVAKGDQTNQTSNVALRFNSSTSSGHNAHFDTINGSLFTNFETNVSLINLRSLGPFNGPYKMYRIRTVFSGANYGGGYGRMFLAEYAGGNSNTSGFIVGNWYDSAPVTSVTFFGTANGMSDSKMVIYGVQ